ncbi:MAG: hypothetical protein FD138_4048 [Planctomycetota bacterium]|nr:MAG: hypothetical protein FD138_4048 [Planctomycetota bacterium]
MLRHHARRQPLRSRHPLTRRVGQSAVMGSQSLEHLPDCLEGRLREDVVGVFGLVDENRNHDWDDRPTADRSRRS